MHSIKYYTFQIISLMQEKLSDNYPEAAQQALGAAEGAQSGRHLPRASTSLPRAISKPISSAQQLFAITERWHRIIKQHSDS